MTISFEVEILALETDALSLEYFRVPWDEDLMARPVAQIRRLEVRDYGAAARDIEAVFCWKAQQGIAFSTARVGHASLVESRLLQANGYCFIELNYHPQADLSIMPLPSVGELPFTFFEATGEDRAKLGDIAGRTFQNTRFHRDPLLGRDIGNHRYACWMRNAFANPHQRVVKCVRDDELLAFFVEERPAPDHVFWSLVGLVPGMQGRGLGRQVWPAAMRWLRDQGVARVSTSISSLNTPVLNLYVRLGFRFPEPEMVFHWHRPDPAA